MSVSPSIGRLTASTELEQTVLALLEANIGDYLSEVEQQTGREIGFLQRPRSAQVSYDFENWPEGQLPALVCVCPGTTGQMVRLAGFQGGWFEVMCGVLVEDVSEQDARTVAELHQAAIDGILLQNEDLGDGFAVALEMVARETRLPDVPNRTLAYAESTYHVLIDRIARHAGPPGPGWPPPEYPTAVRVNPEVDATPVDDPLPPGSQESHDEGSREP